MGIKFTAEVSGQQVLSRAFNRLESIPKDLSGIFKDVEKEFHAIEAENFQSENAKGASGRWKPISKKTEEIKIRKRGTFALLAGTLIDSEALYKSLTGKSNHTVSIINKQGAAFGTNLPYAKLHQTGTKRMPARPPIDLSDAQKRRIQKVIQKGLVDEVRKQTPLTVTEMGVIG